MLCVYVCECSMCVSVVCVCLCCVYVLCEYVCGCLCGDTLVKVGHLQL